ncbi:MAG: protein phosphatase CheZ [Desulfovibrio sp.]|jgi:chemotaxis protein CheZ|nr:protein phosphatase CheZ [Desulfovibrio sp.]
MISQEEILERVLARVSDKVAESVKETVAQAVQRELSSSMSKAMVESEFYRRLNEEMRTGLRGIYREISSASGTLEDESRSGQAGVTQKIFSDATKQIDEIMQTTLEATEHIMSRVEKLQDEQAEAGRLIDSLIAGEGQRETPTRLADLNSSLALALTDIITDLSFQDLTGQRLKKLISAIGAIRETVFDLYVSTGLMLKTREETPERDLEEIAAESRKTVEDIKNSELKGPQVGVSQANVDDLLASLGL